MTLAKASVLLTDHGDGSAKATISIDYEVHRFSIAKSGEEAVVTYEETCTYRGDIRVSEPDEDIFKSLMVSDEVTDFLESHNLYGIRRE